ncbi:flagella synthesis protein FlgN [uncultured Legionella sp.]|uniref:flagella synthesis protein FlgN n=1 Tax=uncultured Legionella sp. TaxID=210934 RepID=UPI0026207532|nr:flagellar protein FlgN [uncultured Legionella sp.]
MNNNNNAKTLIDHLEQEINWIEHLNVLLSEERTVLETRQFDQLDVLAEKKQNLSVQLEASAKQRMALINGSNVDLAPGIALQEFLKDCPANDTQQINILNNKLAEQLSICRDLNTINGQVIANNIHTRQQIVNTLSGNKTESMSVYTSNGDLKSSTDTNHHQKA